MKNLAFSIVPKTVQSGIYGPLADHPADVMALAALAEFLRVQDYRFVTVTPETHRRVLARQAPFWAGSLQDVFGWSRSFRRALLPDRIFDALVQADIVGADQGGWKSRVRVSSFDDFLLFHSAYPTSQPDAVFFGPDSYRFARGLQRHLATVSKPVLRAADIGCGTGIAGLIAASAFPAAEVVFADINDEALRLARVNASIAGARNPIFCRSDILTSIGGNFDLICANPPYLVDPSARFYRHGGGDLGSQISLKIVDAAIERLAPGGSLLLYTGAPIVAGEDPFRLAAAQRLGAAGLDWSYQEVDPDVFGEELDSPAYAEADRIAAVILTAVQP